MNSYSRIYNLLKVQIDENESEQQTRWDRKALAARLKNREVGSMLTRKNQRRLTKVKARLGLGGK